MRVIVPAGEGRAVKVSTGQRVRVTDLDGGQVGDAFAFAAADVNEHLSASHTRAATSRLFPLVGEQFVTEPRRPILTLVTRSCGHAESTNTQSIAASNVIASPGRLTALSQLSRPSPGINGHRPTPLAIDLITQGESER
ncbi:DUF1989 domain-containing protein [Nonomuraea aurantiaca]|uniref:DUF1989 domain-containing protein n=1 Tax=Nonomuraea aurantiaca TaxID=2878562 RepID=UPI001CD97120|nr:DUF1989 domain-containing protein [Nonomuraea aurantiaca]MCA2225299.1 urea carboxylase-associated family protein [Nonomuraea aurantiaca]